MYIVKSSKIVFDVNTLDEAMIVAKCMNEFVTITGKDFEVCGMFGVDSVVNITSHEIYEAMTDSIQSGNAWYDASGYEIGDKCAWSYGATTLAGYAVQTEYSNSKVTCSNS